MKLCVIEDEFMSELIRQLFQENKEHELIFYPDLSDEKVCRRHLPEGYDLYWFHISAIEDEAMEELVAEATEVAKEVKEEVLEEKLDEEK